jgi:hypothetical protein
MPPRKRGNLGDENCLNLIAFLFLANGAQESNQSPSAAVSGAIGIFAAMHASRHQNNQCPASPRPEHQQVSWLPSQQLSSSFMR